MKKGSTLISKRNLEVLESLQSQLHDVRQNLSDDYLEQYWHELVLSWIYHDNALEGVVLTLQELKTSLEGAGNLDLSMIPESEIIIAHRNTIDYVIELSRKKKLQITLPLIKEIYRQLTPDEEGNRQISYRRETLLHRLYFHEISPPEKISYRMRKMVEWAGSAQARKLHPIHYAAEVHSRIITIYPFSTNSGKLARLVMNMVLIHHGFEPLIIHATERQRYYEVLQEPIKSLVRLLVESMKNSLESTVKYLGQAQSRGTG